jgi:ketosteroid isomerase-like protein
MKKGLILTLLWLVGNAGLAQTNQTSEIAKIKKARQASNAAIARHDIEATAQLWTDQVVTVFANGSCTIGKDSTKAVYQKRYEAVPDMIWIRTATVVTLSEDGTSAWESGTWIGKRTRTKTFKPIGGNYAAMWLKQGDAWKIRSEYFVPL